MRGIKVRGVFETLNEAKNRSEFLKRTDKNHNIFIGQVGVIPKHVQQLKIYLLHI